MNLARITQQLTGQKYELGEWDCFRIVHHYLQLQGVALPDEWRGHTLESYAELYQQDKDTAKALQIEFVAEHLKGKPVSRAFAGDIVLAACKRNGAQVLAIHGGNGYIITASNRDGVKPRKRQYYDILRAWHVG
jgi:hypothetical protein